MEDLPLHLYLDVEGSKENNFEFDFQRQFFAMLDELKSFMKAMDLAPDELIDRMEIITLDSSTEKKFSKHCMLKIPDCLFKNNYICGALMRNFHAHLINKYGSADVNPFYLNPEKSAKSEKRVCLVDFAVYTKNRDFRLIGSCKRKGCREAKHIRWLWLENQPNQLNEELFFKCLVQRQIEPVHSKFNDTPVICSFFFVSGTIFHHQSRGHNQ